MANPQHTPDPRLVWAIDLGGTNTKVGVVRQDGEVLAQTSLRTRHERGGPSWAEETAAALEAIARESGAGAQAIHAVGIGSPGPLSVKQGVLTNPMPNLPGWQGFPICSVITDLTGKPSYLDNDANCAALAEHWIGAGRDSDNLIVLTLGTGIGSGVIAEGRLLHGYTDNAGELGHLSINHRGARCACGNRGCIELYACAAAVTRRYRRNLRAAGTAPARARITPKDVFDAALSGDPAAQRTFEEIGTYLGMAIASMVHAFNPQMVVLAGGVAQSGELLLAPVRETVLEHIYPEHREGLQIRASELPEGAGLLGAARLAFLNLPG